VWGTMLKLGLSLLPHSVGTMGSTHRDVIDYLLKNV
jgi:hypothetical protein